MVWPFTTFSKTLARIEQNTETLMADFSKLQAAVTGLTAAVTSAVTDLNALTADIVALKGSVDATVQPQIDAITDSITQTVTNLSNAVSANPA